MPRPLPSAPRRLAATVSELFVDLLRFMNVAVRSRSSLIAENLFLRKQLAFYREHEVKPRRLTDAARISLVLWSRWFDWKEALMIVQPETLIRWHRKGFKLFWRWKSKPGRPRLPRNVRELIAQMVHENPTWGQARVVLGTISETEDLRLAQDGAGLLAVRAGSEITEKILAALAEVCPQSCAIHSRL